MIKNDARLHGNIQKHTKPQVQNCVFMIMTCSMQSYILVKMEVKASADVILLEIIQIQFAVMLVHTLTLSKASRQ